MLFDTEGEWFCNDARNIETERMPDFDLLCAGFPCQAFSIAGRREGFADARGTLFFEVARLVADKRPAYFLLENVPGLLSHDKGRTFHTILSTLSELGYHVEWKVLNSKDFGVPQSRKRVYIVGYLDERCAGKILPFPKTNGTALIQVHPDQTLVNATLEELGLTQYRERHPNTLSGGQKQRVAVAVSMICGKDLLVFDEPTSGLDFDSMTQVAGLIRRLSNMGKVIFIVTHDFEFVCRTCSRVLHFDEGEMPDDVPVTMDALPKLRELFSVSDGKER